MVRERGATITGINRAGSDGTGTPPAPRLHDARSRRHRPVFLGLAKAHRFEGNQAQRSAGRQPGIKSRKCQTRDRVVTARSVREATDQSRRSNNNDVGEAAVLLSMPSTGTVETSVLLRTQRLLVRRGIDPNIGATTVAQKPQWSAGVSTVPKNQGAAVDNRFSSNLIRKIEV